MRTIILIGFALICALSVFAQEANTSDYLEAFEQYKREYKIDRSNEDGPITPADTMYIQFFPADTNFICLAEVEMLDQTDTITMPTVNGKIKRYIKFAYLNFEWNNQTGRLLVFRSVQLLNNPVYKDHLFLPFYDQSNGVESYGGGRYMDLKQTDIIDGQLELDFNKCYNPYCAYTTGYSCPIPPASNTLDFKILVGESAYGKK